MSSAKASCRSSEIMALPPYFTTTTSSRYCLSHGRDSMSVVALKAACSGVVC